MISARLQLRSFRRTNGLLLFLVTPTAIIGTGCDPGPPVRIKVLNEEFAPIACHLLPARLIDPQGSEPGWLFTGPDPLREVATPNPKPEGDYENQLWQDTVVPATANAARLLLPLTSNTSGATVIIDCVWYKHDKESAREALTALCDSTGGCFFSATICVPSGMERLRLIARPWRLQDGRITLSDGVLIWESKASQ